MSMLIERARQRGEKLNQEWLEKGLERGQLDLSAACRIPARHLLALATTLHLISCDQEPRTASGFQCDPHPADIAERDFADAFAPLEPLVFRTTDPSPVLSVRALSVSPSGHLLLTDSRSFDLKVADRQGRIIQVIGGQGEGPGEFTALMDAVFLSDDRILALDAGRVLVTLFDATGEVLSTFPLKDQLDPRTVVAVNESSFLIGGMVTTPEEGNDLARIYSLEGNHSESFLPADQLLFDTQMVVDGVWGVALPGGSLALGLDVTPGHSSFLRIRQSRLHAGVGAAPLVAVAAARRAGRHGPGDARMDPASDLYHRRRARRRWAVQAVPEFRGKRSLVARRV